MCSEEYEASTHKQGFCGCGATSTHQGHWLCVCARECVCYTTLKRLYFIHLCPNLHPTDPEKAVNVSLEHQSISSNIHHVTAMTGKETWLLPCLNPVLFSGVWHLAKIQLRVWGLWRKGTGWVSLTNSDTPHTLFMNWRSVLQQGNKNLFQPPRVYQLQRNHNVWKVCLWNLG